MARKANSDSMLREGGMDIMSESGIPIFNYHLRDLQFGDDMTVQGEDAEYNWVVMMKDSASQEQMDAFCNGACISEGQSGSVPYVTVKGTGPQLQEMLSTHRADIEFAEADLPVFEIPEVPVTPEELVKMSTEFSAQASKVWGHDTIKLNRQSFTGKGVHVYVMDTGGRASHSDFEGRAIPTIDTIANGGTVKVCNGDKNCAVDTHGHGTHCAGTVAGKVYGVAKQATIHIMRVCCGAGSNVLGGFNWMVTNHQKPGLVSMSLGSMGQSPSGERAVNRLTAAGIAVFVSAGNNNIDACKKTYAFIKNTITVGASDPENKRASFSNYGSCVDLYAPGTQVLSASHTSDSGSTYKSGTSMATPMAAGVGALILQQFPNLTPREVKRKMLFFARGWALSGLMPGDPNKLLKAKAS